MTGRPDTLVSTTGLVLAVTDFWLPVLTLRRGPAATWPELVPHLEVRDLVIVAGLVVGVRATTHLVPLVTRRGRRDWHLRHRRSTSRRLVGRTAVGAGLGQGLGLLLV